MSEKLSTKEVVMINSYFGEVNDYIRNDYEASTDSSSSKSTEFSFEVTGITKSDGCLTCTIAILTPSEEVKRAISDSFRNDTQVKAYLNS
jgi:hypothetical protein